MLFYNNFNIKILFLLSIIFILQIPLNGITNLIFITISLLIIFLSQIKEKWNGNYLLLTTVFISFLLTIFLSNKKIEEAHSVFFSKKDIDIISNFLPSKIVKEIKKDYEVKFDLNRALQSWDANFFSSEEVFNNHNFIKKEFAFSSDNFFLGSKFTRNINSINFTKREDLRIGQINTIDFNLVFDKEFRRNIPYYVLFRIPPSYSGSEICTEGNIYFAYDKLDISIVKKLDFKKLSTKCLKLNNNNLYLFGYSINKDDHLSVDLNKNVTGNILIYLLIFLKIIFIFSYYKIFFRLRANTKNDYLIILLSVIITLLIIFIKDPNLITGLRYYRGGGDGLFHEHQGYHIVHEIYQLNFIQALRGGENIFYFMPGLRYFIGISKIFFGETAYGYILITVFLPIFLYKFLKNIISEKVAFYLTLSFLILPIFENMGFGHFNYVHQLIRNHAETLSITIIIYCLYKISDQKFKFNLNFGSTFIYCLLLAFATFCRPNFLPTSTFIFLYIFIISFKKNYILSISAITGYSFVLVSLLHNIYFGNNYSLFTISNIHFVYNEVFQNFNFRGSDNSLIFSQFIKWNPLYNIHRLLILLSIIYFFFKFNKNLFCYMLICCIFSQHLVLLLTHPDSRYAYLAWLLTFVMFNYYLFNNLLKKLK